MLHVVGSTAGTKALLRSWSRGSISDLGYAVSAVAGSRWRGRPMLIVSSKPEFSAQVRTFAETLTPIYV
jgi:hypothetical protein